jgi:hypothetical protein
MGYYCFSDHCRGEHRSKHQICDKFEQNANRIQNDLDRLEQERMDALEADADREMFGDDIEAYGLGNVGFK